MHKQIDDANSRRAKRISLRRRRERHERGMQLIWMVVQLDLYENAEGRNDHNEGGFMMKIHTGNQMKVNFLILHRFKNKFGNIKKISGLRSAYFVRENFFLNKIISITNFNY